MIIKSIQSNFILFTLFVIAICFSSCRPEGCTESYADNFDNKAKEDNGSCKFSSRKISFYTTNEFGGNISVQLASTHIENNGYENSNFRDSIYPWPWAYFKYDGNDISYPRCGSSNLITFKRYSSASYAYVATDELGFEWKGSVSASPGECKLVEIDRAPNNYGRIVFYINNSVNIDEIRREALQITMNPCENKDLNKARTRSIWVQKLSTNEAYHCKNPRVESISSRLGKNTINLKFLGNSLDTILTVVPNECTFYDVSSLIKNL